MAEGNPIRVVVADDSDTIRILLREILTSEEGFEIAAEAADGRQCVEAVGLLRPDIVVMDVDMPGQGGLEATREIMARAPTPILIFTSTAVLKRARLPIEALAAGALDLILKPRIQSEAEFRRIASELRKRLRLLSAIKVIRRPERPPRAPVPVPAAGPGAPPALLAIGASTGGPLALASVLKALPESTGLCALVVQHMAPEFMEGFVGWLSDKIRIPVRCAQAQDDPRAGRVLVAPGDCHMRLGKDGLIVLDRSAPVNSCRPSVDVLFDSVAESAGPRAIGVLLTGIGKDGAWGLKRMREAGCVTMAQDEASSAIFGMPKAAIDLGAARHVLDLDGIGAFLRKAAAQESRR